MAHRKLGSAEADFWADSGFSRSGAVLSRSGAFWDRYGTISERGRFWRIQNPNFAVFTRNNLATLLGMVVESYLSQKKLEDKNGSILCAIRLFHSLLSSFPHGKN